MAKNEFFDKYLLRKNVSNFSHEFRFFSDLKFFISNCMQNFTNLKDFVIHFQSLIKNQIYENFSQKYLKFSRKNFFLQI